MKLRHFIDGQPASNVKLVSRAAGNIMVKDDKYIRMGTFVDYRGNRYLITDGILERDKTQVEKIEMIRD